MSIVDEAVQRFGDVITLDEPLAPRTTYRLGGPAAIFARPRSVDELVALGRFAADHGVRALVLGRGSNMLVADAGFHGLVVSLEQLAEGDRIFIAWIDRVAADAEAVEVELGAACSLPVAARRLVAAGVRGFEWAVGVPGSVGGAVRMNAGGHGSDMAACLVAAQIVDLRTGESGWVGADRLGLRFRGSDLADHQVVVAARLVLRRGDIEAGEAELVDVVHWRREHQPGGQNAGSVFVNPVPGQLAAAQLVDGLGLRGCRVGGAFVSEKHANFIQAGDGATAADVRALIEHVRAEVLAHTGHALRSEIRLVGFDDVSDDEPRGVVIGAGS